MIITIDGSAGTGKSTVAKMLAQRIGFSYFDTGALYRAFAYLLLDRGISLDDEEAISKAIDLFDFSIKEDLSEKRYILNGSDITNEIRSREVTSLSSAIAKEKRVRDFLKSFQIEYGISHNAVFEGRDTGSVIFPDADLKIFLVADSSVRAKRRHLELEEKFPDTKILSIKELQKEMKNRDIADQNREIAPLIKPKGAKKIDTSNLTIDEVIGKIINLIPRSKPSVKLKPCFLTKEKLPLLYRLVLGLTYLASTFLYRTKVYGLEHFCKGPAIIAPNHISYLDPPIVAAACPEEVSFLARKTLFRSLFGKFISHLNAYPVTGAASDIKVIKYVCNLLAEGKKVILFPEGERSYDNKLGELKSGIAMLVTKSKSAIIPTYIYGNHEIWPRGKKKPKLFGNASVVFGSPLFYKDYEHLNKKEAQIKILEDLERSILALRKWFESGAVGNVP